MTHSQPSILRIENLSVHFKVGDALRVRKRTLKAVSGVSLTVRPGELLSIVGESGSGKTTLGKAVMKAVPYNEGQIVYDDGERVLDVGKLSRPETLEYRKRVQLIFQNPFSSLSPRMTVRDIIAEPLEVMGLTSSKQEADDRVREIALKCKLSQEHLRRYPHAFSGGQRQRISIARALVSKPDVVIADESVASLDVSIKADILNLIKSIQEDLGVTVIFISHDLSVVSNISDRVAVMYLGTIVEVAPSDDLFQRPFHPYTDALLGAVLPLDPDAKRVPRKLRGEIPSPLDPPKGCVFHTRCPYAKDICKQEVPALRTASDNRDVACHFADDFDFARQD